MLDPPVSAVPGGWVDLPGRGRAWVWDSGPAGPEVRRADPDRPAPALVLLHGWTSTAALNWCRCLRPLAATGRVVAMDHRGHGRGIRSTRPFSLEDCADDVAALIDALALGPAVVVGYSMGGGIAQLVWRRHPASVAGLVLCATATNFHDGPLPPLAMQALGLGLSVALAAVPAGVLHGGARLLARSLGDNGPAPAAWAVEESTAGDPVAYVQAAAALAAFDSSGWIGGLDRPAAVIVTTEDHTVAPDRQRLLAGAIPGAATFTVDADHRACVEAADRFVPALLAACGAAGG